MKVQTERLPGSLARLEIEIEPERVSRELDRAYRRLANRVQVPGFRRGKAPRVMIERTLGEGALLEEATRDLIPDAISEAVKQENLDVIGEPDDFDMVETEPLRFKVSVPLVPTVTLGDYKAVRAERQPVSVSDEEVEEVVAQLREREVEWVTPEPPRPAQEGDQLTLDIQDFVEGEPLGEVQQDMTVVLGEGPLMEELDSQLVGVEDGGEYEFEAVLPEDHRLPEMAGKSARFKVSVKSIKEKRLPEVDDAFAARVGEGVESAEQLRTRIRENLEARKQSQERERLLGDVIGQVVATAEVDMPDVLVEREVGHRMEHFEEGLRNQGLSLRQYLQFTNQTEEDARAELREPARERLVRGLVLGEVGKAEDIQVADEEVDREVERVAARISEEEREEARRYLEGEEWRSSMRSELYDRKLLNHLVEIATGEPLDTPGEDEPVDALSQPADDQIAVAVEDAELERASAELSEPDQAAPQA